MLPGIEWRIALLGQWGFSARCIQDRVIKVSLSTIYSKLKKHKVRIKDYRDGLSIEARDTIKELMLAPTRTTSVGKTKRKYVKLKRRRKMQLV